MPEHDPIFATVTAATLDPEKRLVFFHLQATPPGGPALSLLLPLHLPTEAEVREMVKEEETEAEVAADACPGCGCLPGDGRTPGCHHPEGCGYTDHEVETPEFYGRPGEGKTVAPEEATPTAKPRSLSQALRILAEYLSPTDLPKEVREGLFLPEAEAPDYGPAGRELVIDRLEDDLHLYMEGGAGEGEDRVAQVAAVLHSIMGGETPHEALASRGLLDG